MNDEPINNSPPSRGISSIGISHGDLRMVVDGKEVIISKEQVPVLLGFIRKHWDQPKE